MVHWNILQIHSSASRGAETALSGLQIEPLRQNLEKTSEELHRTTSEFDKVQARAASTLPVLLPCSHRRARSSGHLLAKFFPGLQTRTEKVQALMRAGQAEQTAEQAFEETGKILDQINDLKERAAQVWSTPVPYVWHLSSFHCIVSSINSCRDGWPSSNGVCNKEK